MNGYSASTVVLTGAAGGIGAAIGEKILVSGRKLIALDLGEALKRRWGGRENVVCLSSDLADPSVAQNLRELLSLEATEVSGFVHAAGSLRNGPVQSLSDDDWDNVLEVHLNSAFRLIRTLTPHLTVSASIVLISSTSVLGSRYMVNYSAAKAGMLGLSKALAIELGRSHGVRVNTILPGPIDTPMLRSGPKEWVEKVQSKVPLNRLGQPDDIANLAEFLLSEKAEFINGADIVIDGGLTLGG